MKKIYLLLLVTVLAFAGNPKSAFAGGNCAIIDTWEVLDPTAAIYPFGIVTGTYSAAAVLSGDLFYEGSFLSNYESTDGTIFLFDLLPGNYEFVYCGGTIPFTINPIACDISIANIGSTNVSGAGCTPNGAIDLTVTSSTQGQTYFYNLAEINTLETYTGQDDGFGIISIQNLPAGDYVIFIATTDDVLSATCFATDVLTITEPNCDMAIPTFGGSNVTSQGASDGALTVTVTGGSCIPTAPGGNPIYTVYAELNGNYYADLTYNANNGNYELVGLSGGTYTVIAENGGTTCFASQDITVGGGVPPTELANGVCGNLNYVKTSAIGCVLVPSATQYEWEFSNANGVFATKLSPVNYIVFHSVTPSLNWGTTWSVRVRAFIGSNAGIFSEPCTIGIVADPAVSGVQLTKLRIQDCGKLNYRINANNRIITQPVGGAIQYEFEFSEIGTGTVVATAIRNSNVLFFNTVTPSLSFPAQYNVKTRARVGSIWGNYGPSCLIGIIGLNRDGAEAEQELAYDADGNVIVDAPYFDLTAMPNPYSEFTSLVINSSINENVYVQFYDMTGKLVEDIKVTTNNRFNVGANLSKGIYLLKASSDSGNQLTTRLVKTN
jgi:hypothetical protein